MARTNSNPYCIEPRLIAMGWTDRWLEGVLDWIGLDWVVGKLLLGKGAKEG